MVTRKIQTRQLCCFKQADSRKGPTARKTIKDASEGASKRRYLQSLTNYGKPKSPENPKTHQKATNLSGKRQGRPNNGTPTKTKNIYTG